jgi:hypothetical protein
MVFEDNWEPYARETVAVLRREAAMYPQDPRLRAMIEQLSRDSSEFRAWWAEHEVETHHYGSKRYNHPIAGPIVVFHEATRLREVDQWLYLYWVEPDSPSEAAMRRLQSWVADRDAARASGARQATINLRC